MCVFSGQTIQEVLFWIECVMAFWYKAETAAKMLTWRSKMIRKIYFLLLTDNWSQKNRTSSILDERVWEIWSRVVTITKILIHDFTIFCFQAKHDLQRVWFEEMRTAIKHNLNHATHSFSHNSFICVFVKATMPKTYHQVDNHQVSYSIKHWFNFKEITYITKNLLFLFILVWICITT